MNYIAITSDQPRHREFINRIEKYTSLSHVIVVSKPEGNKEFCKSEDRFFSKHRKKVDAEIIQCTKHQLGSKRMQEMLKEMDPEVCFVFGAPLLKKDFYNIPRRGCVNIHTGLVQHHRGVDSPFWAIDEGRADTIGATLHFIDCSIDGGKIIAQKNTTGLTIEDTPEDIFMRTCNTGFDILEENIYNILYDSVTAYPLKERGKLYQTKDMNYDKMLEIRHKTPYLLKEYLNGNNSRSM
tara:strand:+ start:609 stop:1322 length:714 start_codon:yes stop_codon:yes gene_type:complete